MACMPHRNFCAGKQLEFALVGKYDNQDSRSIPQGRRGIQEREVRQLRGERPGAQGVVRQEQG